MNQGTCVNTQHSCIMQTCLAIRKVGEMRRKLKQKGFYLGLFVMHPPSVTASVRPNKNILEQKAISVEIPLVTPVSQGAACSKEEKPSITGVAVTESDDLNNVQDYGISGNW